MGSTMDGFSWRGTEERISELKDKIIEITQYEQQRENRLEEKKNKASGNRETINKRANFVSLESEEERQKRVG